MGKDQRQGLNCHVELVDYSTYDLVDGDAVGSSLASSAQDDDNMRLSLTDAFEQMLINSKQSLGGSKTAADPPAATSKSGVKPTDPPVVPPKHSSGSATVKLIEPDVVAPPKKKQFELEARKILRGWPDKELPKFGATVNENPTQWLGMMAMVLKDQQAHPAIWHLCASQCLTGQAWQDFYNPVFLAPPEDWAGFKAWLIKFSPLGITNLLVARELKKLKQKPKETAQFFHKRYWVWQTKANSIKFGYAKISSFVRGLTPGLSAKVQEIMAAAAIEGKPMEMCCVLLTAVGHNHLY
ncbi:hypothetical protein PTTG_28094 [Puccinia triticina 1-1 BBBD Race 1]|uniref:Retrotransposon gag domain-containing protein n=1 Tax=Puccinia triticina (isolate 1-1 / race 1 (BBBD)) TaxID=630390 RepID=A0A180GEH7_PUCT1|nr:hypothetical protein PTTG_28094 [Puccinia triticina 1-1 BBBD Race 1]